MMTLDEYARRSRQVCDAVAENVLSAQATLIVAMEALNAELTPAQQDQKANFEAVIDTEMKRMQALLDLGPSPELIGETRMDIFKLGGRAKTAPTLRDQPGPMARHLSELFF